MFKMPNPYILLAGALALASIGGTFRFLSGQVHHYHSLYDCAEYGKGCPKGTENIPDLKATIVNMTEAQKTQTNKSEGAVIKVVQGPKEIQSIIREIKAAPAQGCIPPKYPEDVTNAF